MILPTHGIAATVASFFLLIFQCCGQKNSTIHIDEERVDTVFNTYSNYEHGIGVNLPDNWDLDYGISKHTIIRGFEPDSGYTFTINVIKLDGDNANTDRNKEKPIDFWAEYKKNSKSIDEESIKMLEKSLNTEVVLVSAERSYIKQRSCLRRVMKYVSKEIDLEYENTMIMYSYATNQRMFTITLTMPTLFYEKNNQYFEDIFLHIHFPVLQ